MTNREFFEKVIALVEETEVVEHATKELEKLNMRNEKRRNAISKKAEENAPIKEKILEYLVSKEKVLCKEIADAVEISTQKCSALCRQLVDDGSLIVEDVKVKSKGVMKAYTKN